MKVLVACDAYVFITPDGNHWTDSIYGYDFWKRYMDIYSEVKVVARTMYVTEKNPKWLSMDGYGLSFAEVPFYRGPKQLVLKYFMIRKALREIDSDCDVAILRMPSQTAFMTWRHLRKGIPLGGEIVYDPTDDLVNSDSFLMKTINWMIVRYLRDFCSKANGVSYVTENAIQQHFPSYARINGATKTYFETFYSTITLHDNAFAKPKVYEKTEKTTLALSSVSMNSERKGERVLIDIVKKCREKGYNVYAIIIGDGDLRTEFEDYAKRIGVDQYINFTGLLSSSDAVREVLSEADMYVFPTRGEGLPRGILEAMAIGLPVLSTPVGGIPEVLERDCLFEPKDVIGFSNRICYLIDHVEELTRLSDRNYRKALEYRNTILQLRRNEFYQRLANLV